MEIAFAPLEGITGYIYRNVHHKYFSGVDRYFAPFIDAKQEGCIKKSELRDVFPENNPDILVIPQILAANATNFLNALKLIENMGYNEVNLNLGCPSKTVVTKGKGAGFLGKPEELDAFFEQVFSKTNLLISVKTRIGMSQVNEFENLVNIYNRYPIKELIVHPRLQSDYYKNDITYEAFSYAAEHCIHPLCYNGDITDEKSYQKVLERFPDIERIMIGRGFIQNPGLGFTLKEHKYYKNETYCCFFEELLDEYQQFLHGERNVMFKMKEVMLFMVKAFENSEKYIKSIKKAQTVKELKIVAYTLLRNEPLKNN